MKKRVFAFVSTILIPISFCSAGINYGPYLTCPSTDGAVVQYGKDIWDSAEIEWADSAEFAASGLINSADIGEFDARASYRITGYSPNSLVYYRISAGTESSDIFWFRTLPTPGSPVNFCIYGDSRTGEAIHTSICEKMVAKSPRVVIHTGDLGDAAWEVGDWEMFFRASDTIASKVPFISTIGNHELPYTIYKYLFDLPGNEEWFATHVGCVSFICINLYSNYLPGSEQYEWLVATLIDSIPPTSLWTVIVQHESAYSTSNHGGNIVVLEYLKPLYDSLGVDVVAAGHDHCYEHSYAGGVHYFVAGGAGAPLYSVDGGPHTVYKESAYHYIEAFADSADLCFNTWRDDDVLMETFCLSDFPLNISEPELPNVLSISAYPNPFNASITINIDNRSESRSVEQIGSGPAGVGADFTTASVEIYDVSGRKIADAEPVEAGAGRLEKDTSTGSVPSFAPLNKGGKGCSYIWRPAPSLPSGVYLVRATGGGRGDLAPTGQTTTKRIVYLK